MRGASARAGEAGRQHVATGRIREAMACFKRAADDPERGAEALSLLAAAYLLPGSLAPELALARAPRGQPPGRRRRAPGPLCRRGPDRRRPVTGRGSPAGPAGPVAARPWPSGPPPCCASATWPGSGPCWRAGAGLGPGRVLAPPAGRGVGGRADGRRPRRPPGHAPRWAPAPALPDVLVRAAVGPLFVACLAAATVLSVAAPERLATVRSGSWLSAWAWPCSPR